MCHGQRESQLYDCSSRIRYEQRVSSTQMESYDRILHNPAPLDTWTIWHGDGTRLTLDTNDGGFS